MRKAVYLIVVLVTFSCVKREFDHDEDFMHDEIKEVFKDNTVLYSKIFKIKETHTYLWFDIDNEIANFSRPVLKIVYRVNRNRKVLDLKLKGMLYEYDQKKQELSFVNIPSELTGMDEPLDFIFSIKNKDKEKCDTPQYINFKNCGNKFVITLKAVRFLKTGQLIEADKEIEYSNLLWSFEKGNYDLILLN